MTASPSPQPEKSGRRIWPIVVGCVLFVALIALRYEVAAVWVRAAMAGCAFAALVWGVEASRKSGS